MSKVGQLGYIGIKLYCLNSKASGEYIAHREKMYETLIPEIELQDG